MLQNKIDFLMLVSAKNANPNGDPLNGNIPRVTDSGLGEISDVCIKRKIRNRWLDMGESIFVQSDDKNKDGYPSLRARADANENLKKKEKEKDRDAYAQVACESWLDVRAFGQVFAYKGEKKGGGISVGIRGPVSLHPAFTVDIVDIDSIQITKSVNGETTDDGKKTSDTMGMKHRVNFGLYVVKGSVNVQLAEKTGFTDEDAEKLKEALQTLFVNDVSSARPDGSMEVHKLYWWEHNCKIGQYSAAKVHGSVHIKRKEGAETPTSYEDYLVEVMPLENLKMTEYDGL